MNDRLEVVANIEEMRNACKIFVRVPEGKIRLGKPNFGRKDIIEVVVRKCDKAGMDRVYIAHNRPERWAVVNMSQLFTGPRHAVQEVCRLYFTFAITSSPVKCSHLLRFSN